MDLKGISGVDFNEIGWLVSDDRRSLEYLWDKLGNKSCPRCGSPNVYVVVSPDKLQNLIA